MPPNHNPFICPDSKLFLFSCVDILCSFHSVILVAVILLKIQKLYLTLAKCLRFKVLFPRRELSRLDVDSSLILTIGWKRWLGLEMKRGKEMWRAVAKYNLLLDPLPGAFIRLTWGGIKTIVPRPYCTSLSRNTKGQDLGKCARTTYSSGIHSSKLQILLCVN